MRYFRIMYASRLKIYNSFLTKSEKHPNEIEFEKNVNSVHPGTGKVMITGIHEFQSEEDYIEFTRLIKA